MAKIILINSGQRCGKDTAADILKDRLTELDKSVLIIPFAEPVKKVVSEFLGVTVEELDVMKNEKTNVTVGKRSLSARDFIIEYSNDIKVMTSEYYFLNKTIDTIMETAYDVYIIPDLRYIIEYERFKRLDFDTDFIQIDSNLESCVDDTEIKELPYDFTFKNIDGDLTQLKFDIEEYVVKKIFSA